MEIDFGNLNMTSLSYRRRLKIGRDFTFMGVDRARTNKSEKPASNIRQKLRHTHFIFSLSLAFKEIKVTQNKDRR